MDIKTLRPYEHGALRLEPQESATLPKLIELMIRVSRKLECLVSSTWNGAAILVSPEDTFQGVQTRTLDALARKPLTPADFGV